MLRRWIVTSLLLLLLGIVLGNASGCKETKPANVNEEEKKKADEDMEKTKTPPPKAP